jgi:hypothetical protein
VAVLASNDWRLLAARILYGSHAKLQLPIVGKCRKQLLVLMFRFPTEKIRGAWFRGHELIYSILNFRNSRRN